MNYEIKGEPMPVVICDLNAGETMITEKGSMVWMSPNMEMQTSAGGSLGKAFGRMFSGESMFQNLYTAKGAPGMIAFASSFPGVIRAVEIGPGKSIVCQKSAFLASEQGVELSAGRPVPELNHPQEDLGNISLQAGGGDILPHHVQTVQGVQKIHPGQFQGLDKRGGGEPDAEHQELAEGL